MKKKTQEQRSESTKLLLLNATIDSLVSEGYSKSTLQRIADKTNLTRGAQIHHFPNKQELMVAATEYLFDCFKEEVENLARETAVHKMEVNDFIENVWQCFFTGRFYYASLELIIASRNDESLKKRLKPLIQKLHFSLDEIWRKYFKETNLTSAKIETLLNLTLCLFRGMAVQTVLKEDENYYRELLNAWKEILPKMVES